MARFEVFDGPEANTRLLDVQADLLDGLNTRIVVPLMPMDQAPAPAKRLNPIFDIAGEPYVMLTQFLTAVPLSVLGAKRANLSAHDSEITGALDLALTGI